VNATEKEMLKAMATGAGKAEKDELSFMLNNIPTWLWKAAKQTAADEGVTLKQLVLKSIAQYLDAG
jgi:hypothetical protein